MKNFPIMGSKVIKEIPWNLIKSHEKFAQHNHSQSLNQLASRGGLSPCEAVAVIEDIHYRTRWPKVSVLYTRKQHDLHAQESEEALQKLVAAFTPSNQLAEK